MKKHQIFLGELPPVTVEVAMKLAIYWRVAGDCVGIIDENGCLRYGENSVWLRPMAQKSFWVLKEAFKECKSPVVKVEEKQITVDFTKIQYNLEWVKEFIAKNDFGVCDSMLGLMVYEPKQSAGNLWYFESELRFMHVTVKDLDLKESRFSSLSPDQDDPCAAEWKTLYFAN